MTRDYDSQEDEFIFSKNSTISLKSLLAPVIGLTKHAYGKRSNSNKFLKSFTQITNNLSRASSHRLFQEFCKVCKKFPGFSA